MICNCWELSGGNCLGWELSGVVIVHGGNCPRWEFSRMRIVQGVNFTGRNNRGVNYLVWDLPCIGRNYPGWEFSKINR